MKEDIWLYQVYGSPDASGNLTAIVLCRDTWSKDDMQRLAVRLGYPDTGFVSIEGREVSVRAFSPTAELAFCSQTTLALGAMLVQTSLMGEWSQLAVQTAGGQVILERAREHRRFWVHLNVPGETAHVDAAALRRLLGLSDSETGPLLVIGFGRKRAYLSLTSVTRLYELAPLPEQVMAYCQENGVNGICVFVEDAGTIKIRVFTTSLSGAEDASTGGAVAAVPHYIDQVLGSAQQRVWSVDQGAGPPAKRGRLYVKSMKGAGHIAIGGDTFPVSSGTLSEVAHLPTGSMAWAAAIGE